MKRGENLWGYHPEDTVSGLIREPEVCHVVWRAHGAGTQPRTHLDESERKSLWDHLDE
jgi:hypothetical protein